MGLIGVGWRVPSLAGSGRWGTQLRGCHPRRPGNGPYPDLCRYAERPIDLIQLEVRDVQVLSTTHPGLTRSPTDVPVQLP